MIFSLVPTFQQNKIGHWKILSLTQNLERKDIIKKLCLTRIVMRIPQVRLQKAKRKSKKFLMIPIITLSALILFQNE